MPLAQGYQPSRLRPSDPQEERTKHFHPLLLQPPLPRGLGQATRTPAKTQSRPNPATDVPTCTRRTHTGRCSEGTHSAPRLPIQHPPQSGRSGLATQTGWPCHSFPKPDWEDPRPASSHCPRSLFPSSCDPSLLLRVLSHRHDSTQRPRPQACLAWPAIPDSRTQGLTHPESPGCRPAPEH